MAINPITLLDGTTAYAVDVEAKVNPLYTDIDNSNIAAGAGILYSKLETTAIVGIANVQTITGAKTFSDGKLIVGGAGSGVATVKYATSINDRTYTMPDVGADAEFVMTSIAGNTGPLPPLGSIISFYQFGLQGGGSPAIDIDTNYWRFCDGSLNVTFGDGVARSLPDLSNRYLVGFGTEGGADIGTTAWNTAAVGNASHQISLEHLHTQDAHKHTVNPPNTATGASSATDSGDSGILTTSAVAAHAHTGPSHLHDSGTLYARIGWKTAGWLGASQTTEFSSSTNHSFGTTTTSGSPMDVYGTVVVGSTDLGGNGNTGNAGGHDHTIASHAHTITHTHNLDIAVFDSQTVTATNQNALSATQSIQPRSVRVRYIMRIK